VLITYADITWVSEPCMCGRSLFWESMGEIIFTPGRYRPRNGQASGEIYKEISQIHSEAVIAPGYNRGTSGDGRWAQPAV